MLTIPSVSICLLTYNRAAILPRSIESLLLQDFGDFELIISDNASPDNTEAVCREYAAQDRRIRYRRNDKNLGMIGNYNAAFAAAVGTLVAIVHDGDHYRPDLIRKWRDALLAQPDAAFVFNDLEAIDFQGKHRHFYLHDYPRRFERLELTRMMLTRPDSPVFGMVMLRRACVEASGPFRLEYGMIGDVEMWMRLNLDYPVAFVGEPLIQIVPREPGHPLSYVNWFNEQCFISIHRRTIETLVTRGEGDRGTLLRQLRRLREKRWLVLAASTLKRRRFDLLREGLALFRRDDSVLLRTVGWMLRPLA